MKAAIFPWVLLFFFLTGGLAISSYQFENSAQISSADFIRSDRLDAQTSSSTIRRFRACGRKFVAPAQTVIASAISFQLVLHSDMPCAPALLFRQTGQTLDVVLQI
jgi:hypothetical protein